MEGKKGCPLSSTLFGICIDRLEEMIAVVSSSEGLQGPEIGIWTILLLLYADAIVLISDSAAGKHCYLNAVHIFA